MSLKTHENYAAAKIVTFDKQVIFLTPDEYLIYNKIKGSKEIKMLEFDDGEVSLADIRRVEPVVHPSTNYNGRLLSGAKEADLYEDEWLDMMGDRLTKQGKIFPLDKSYI